MFFHNLNARHETLIKNSGVDPLVPDDPLDPIHGPCRSLWVRGIGRETAALIVKNALMSRAKTQYVKVGVKKLDN